MFCPANSFIYFVCLCLDAGADFLWTNAFFHRVLSRKGPWSQEWGAQHKGVMNGRLCVGLHRLPSRLRDRKTEGNPRTYWPCISLGRQELC